MGGLYVVDLEAHLDDHMGVTTVAEIEDRMGMPAIRLTKDDDLRELRKAKKIFVTGSADMLADADWAPGVAHAIHMAAAADIPVLAVCFGHQLLAKHFGGRIGSFEQVRKGIEEIRFAPTGPFAGSARLIHTHRDHVIETGDMLPAGGGGFGGIAAMRHPILPIWTCQGHPEWNAEICRIDGEAWREYSDEELDSTGGDILQRFAAM